MDFSLNISKGDFVINNASQLLNDNDLAYLEKDNLCFFNENLGHSSFSGWSPSPILTGISDSYNQNMIPLISNKNFTPFSQNLVATPNFPVYNSLVAEVPSNYSFMNINSYSKTNPFEEPMYTIPNNNQNFTANGIPYPTTIEPKDTNQEKTFKVVKRKSKEKWSPDEDKKLRAEVKAYGEKRWSFIAKHIKGRKGKQCRERWKNHLRSKFKRDPWSEEEDEILIEAHKAVGNKWTEISLELPGRSENAVKNHWNVAIRRVFSTNRSYDDILKNYIKSITINNDPPNDTSNENMSLSFDVSTQTDEPSINASTSSVPEPTTSSWDDYFAKVCDSVDFKKVMNGWESFVIEDK